MLRFFKGKAAPETDEALVEQYRQTGDMAVLGKLYQRYMELVYGVCLKYLKSSSLAEDAVMAIFEELVVKIKRYEIDKFRPWLHVLTKNHCLMYLRKENKSSLTIFYDTELMQSVDLPHPLDEPDVEERFQSLENCIDQLPLQQKGCIELFYYQNKSYKEIATSKNLELSKVRSFIQNGRRNLKNCIEKKKALHKIKGTNE